MTRCTTRMTSRERVIAAIDFTGPDRVPQMFCALPSAYAVHNACRICTRATRAILPARTARRRKCCPRNSPPASGPTSGIAPGACCRSGWIGQVTVHPLANLDRLRDFSGRSPEESPGLEDARQLAANRGTKYLRLGWMTFWERMIGWWGSRTC